MAKDKTSDLSEMTFARFDELKNVHRQELLSLPPDEAQAYVDTVLHPSLWRVDDPKQLAWPGDWADDEKGD